MSDLISRQAAIEFIDYLLSQPCKEHTGDFVEGMRDGYYRIRSGIKYLPSAQCRTGRWIRKTDTRFGEMLNDILICSECGIAFSTLNMIRRSYCSNCGARMVKEGEEHD